MGIFVIGFFMSNFGIDNRFNGMMMRNMPFYAQNIQTKEKQWMQPEQGFLAGTINNISGNSINLNDLNSEQWNVQMNEKTLVRPAADISVGQMIKIIGTKQDGATFSAVEIRPWVGRGMMGANGQDGTCGINPADTCASPGGGMMR
jgi:hypothetical protein